MLQKSSNFRRLELGSAAKRDGKQCILCYLAQDQHLKTSCGMLMNKLKFFVSDFIVFKPRSSAQSDADIESAVNANFFDKLPPFTQQEISAFRRITQRLKPKDAVKVSQTLTTIHEHVCVDRMAFETPERE